ncbi:MAG: TIR domain-containing protein [Boseongicola sp.]|nr:TIR domain-containing protein [Boseongicola sp.]
MKVFLSWSGPRSHQVALVFREWLPSVIQELEPYVSSEDIDKGARWSTDIAKELSDSKFGILCVTRDNIDAPWLTFEAGALSKTMDKSFVSPFLFDIKRSEVDGPILQFQSTIFEKEDLKKLVTTLNKACDTDGLPDERLNKAFEVWYPTLEHALEALKDVHQNDKEDDTLQDLQTPVAQQILEEILELSRSNQKLIRNADGELAHSLGELTDRLKRLLRQMQRSEDPLRHPKSRRRHHVILRELMHLAPPRGKSHVRAQIALALFRDVYPWIYDAGTETLRVLQSRKSVQDKEAAVHYFDDVLRLTVEHPVSRELFDGDGDTHYLLHRLSELIREP